MELDPAAAPPIPARVRHHGRPRSLQPPSAVKRASMPPASPEVISNLITSLSVISKPANNHFEASPTSLSVPTSPGHGSFGVDYGAFHSLNTDDLRQAAVSLDDLAAAPPVVRTSKPPSGYSPLTAAKSPKSPRSPSRESGLRSFIRNSTSRPSSKGSSVSKNDDTHSIGNLSIERRSAPSPELNHQRSHDSWGKKTGRSSKGLMYMSSKEQLREKEVERKRASGGLPASASGVLATGSSTHSGGRGDPFFAETAIHEEPSHNARPERRMESPCPIPVRDSSLRRSTQSVKRSSARRSKRDSDGPLSDVIPETEEYGRSREHGRRKRHSDQDMLRASAKSPIYGFDDSHSPTRTKTMAGRSFLDVGDDLPGDDDEDEGAPFPAVAQGRRRHHSSDRNSRRRSGHHSPIPPDGLKLKRSSSRLKRLSAGINPKSEERQESPARDSQIPIPNGYERPQSADSVDDAVESYLCSPRLSQKIKHPQTGRVISFSEVGDSEGSAVFCCVGMGLTRYITAFYDELALTLKLRLITPDRPGVGDSEPYSDGTATPLSWPDDVYAICQALKITKFSILAHSAGAIYALATALRMPQHIRGRIHLLAPWIPPSQMNVFGTSQTLPPTNAIPTSQRILRALPTPLLKAANSSFMTATSSSITSSLPKNPRRSKRKSNVNGKDGKDGHRNVTPSLDKENIGHEGYGKSPNAMMNGDMPLEQPNATENMDRMHPPQGTRNPETAILAAAQDAMADKERQVTYDLRLTHAIWELATTGANPAVDLLVCLERRHTIGFRYVDITRPVVIHHGSRDTRVPVDNVKWLGKTMRRCEVRVLEGEGHGLMASAMVMGSVLMEMSKEWEDWMKVTGADGRRDRERGRRGPLTRS
ncbi:Alpha/Beta hydrolase protein [Ilyonectria robusta]|uniref:Alpha/Beta hydrolase protein n=1 Tax=Ilyonectria robusta TaxID=1079257 RepID=UPI001E8DC2FA|nr:Alpha/Beta hydrolase protein [Ilyonectria robusta]KAH6971008.1 Alpha/Beta hydrolase protein [Ilyonectria sp. MPI-CAGE-AT-0026]KAH8675111.1 Alpha/Beta hydrolase protein [Ilyonectria robusta]